MKQSEIILNRVPGRLWIATGVRVLQIFKKSHTSYCSKYDIINIL